MQIIKDRTIAPDHWAYIPDDQPLEGDITVSVQRWQNEKNDLMRRSGKLGLRLVPSDDVATIVADLQHFQLIEIEFPSFADGRGFSQARLLRHRYHYGGELRAVGQFLRDQLFYLQRVGFNAFALEKQDDLTGVLAAFDDFSVTYQTSSQ
ncbi:MAG: DUF934 domain-containing protein [Gammaproteobacteria bacterium]